jgi:signal transduction histidine kinase
MRDDLLQRLFAAQVGAGNVLASIETGDHTGARKLANGVVREIGGAIAELRAAVTVLTD